MCTIYAFVFYVLVYTTNTHKSQTESDQSREQVRQSRYPSRMSISHVGGWPCCTCCLPPRMHRNRSTGLESRQLHWGMWHPTDLFTLTGDDFSPNYILTQTLLQSYSASHKAHLDSIRLCWTPLSLSPGFVYSAKNKNNLTNDFFLEKKNMQKQDKETYPPRNCCDSHQFKQDSSSATKMTDFLK